MTSWCRWLLLALVLISGTSGSVGQTVRAHASEADVLRKTEERQFMDCWRWTSPAVATGNRIGEMMFVGITHRHRRWVDTDYYVGFVTAAKSAQGRVTATLADGTALRVEERTSTNTALVSNIESLVFELSRAQFEQGAAAGMQVIVDASGQRIPLNFPKNLFSAVLKKCEGKLDILPRLLDQQEAAVSQAQSIEGTGGITGQLFSMTRGGEVRYGAGQMVYLLPANAYTEDLLDEIRTLDGKMHTAANDPVWPHVQTCQADGNGNFEFTDLAPGAYLLWGSVTWQIPGRYGLETTGGMNSGSAIVKEGKPTRLMLN